MRGIVPEHILARPMHQVTRSKPTSVYRYYDACGVLIYVGITAHGVQRNKQHNGDKAWWPFVATQELDHFPTRALAEAEEKRLIRLHRPPFNRQHNPDHVARRAAYMEIVRRFASMDVATPLATDAAAMYSEVGKEIPLVLLTEPDVRNRITLATLPIHGLLTDDLAFDATDKQAGTAIDLRTGSKVARLERIEHRGSSCLLTMSAKAQWHGFESGVLRLRLVTNKRPSKFAVRGLHFRSIKQDHEPARTDGEYAEIAEAIAGIMRGAA